MVHIYIFLQFYSSIACFVWKPEHFEFQSYGGAWHKATSWFVMLVHIWCAPTSRFHTKLCKILWNISTNISGLGKCADVKLGQVSCLFISNKITISWLYPLNGFWSIFLLRVSENDLYKRFCILGLILKQREKANWKWPIVISDLSSIKYLFIQEYFSRRVLGNFPSIHQFTSAADQSVAVTK